MRKCGKSRMRAINESILNGTGYWRYIEKKKTIRNDWEKKGKMS